MNGIFMIYIKQFSHYFHSHSIHFVLLYHLKGYLMPFLFQVFLLFFPHKLNLLIYIPSLFCFIFDSLHHLRWYLKSSFSIKLFINSIYSYTFLHFATIFFHSYSYLSSIKDYYQANSLAEKTIQLQLKINRNVRIILY